MSATNPEVNRPQHANNNAAYPIKAVARLPKWAGYAITLVLEAALTAGLLALIPYFPLYRFPIPYVLLIMFVAYVFGEGPAILAFALGLIVFDYYFVPPLHTLFPHAQTPMGWATLTAFLMGTFVVGLSSILMRRSRERVVKTAQALCEVEAHKLEFYRRTLMAATAGKLIITDRETIEAIAGPALAVWQIRKAEDLKTIRDGVARLAEDAGMECPVVGKFQICVGEAATNALKHAGGGAASLHRTNDSLMFIVTDRGPGIEALTLPDVALTPGYSTAGTLGMGYKVMLSFAGKVHLATGPAGTTVAIQMDLHAAGDEQ